MFLRISGIYFHRTKILRNRSNRRAQTSANAKISTKRHPGFQSELTDCSGSGSGCLSDLSQNAVDALSRRRQSFRQVWYTNRPLVSSVLVLFRAAVSAIVSLAVLLTV